MRDATEGHIILAEGLAHLQTLVYFRERLQDLQGKHFFLCFERAEDMYDLRNRGKDDLQQFRSLQHCCQILLLKLLNRRLGIEVTCEGHTVEGRF